MKKVWDVQIGERIRGLRLQKEYTQRTLAEKSGLSLRAVSEIENGRRSLSAEELYRIAKALSVSSDEILSGTRESSAVKNFLRTLDAMGPEKLSRMKELLELLGDICDLI